MLAYASGAGTRSSIGRFTCPGGGPTRSSASPLMVTVDGDTAVLEIVWLGPHMGPLSRRPASYRRWGGASRLGRRLVAGDGTTVIAHAARPSGCRADRPAS